MKHSYHLGMGRGHRDETGLSINHCKQARSIGRLFEAPQGARAPEVTDPVVGPKVLQENDSADVGLRDYAVEPSDPFIRSKTTKYPMARETRCGRGHHRDERFPVPHPVGSFEAPGRVAEHGDALGAGGPARLPGHAGRTPPVRPRGRRAASKAAVSRRPRPGRGTDRLILAAGALIRRRHSLPSGPFARWKCGSALECRSSTSGRGGEGSCRHSPPVGFGRGRSRLDKGAGRVRRNVVIEEVLDGKAPGR